MRLIIPYGIYRRGLLFGLATLIFNPATPLFLKIDMRDEAYRYEKECKRYDMGRSHLKFDMRHQTY